MIYPELRTVRHGLPDDVAVWWVDLDAYATRVDDAALEEEERVHARRMASPTDGTRFLARRHALRAVAAHHLGVDVSEVVIRRDLRGRPSLADGAGFVSASGSGAEALLAFSPSRGVGVDIEVVRALPDGAVVARDAFTEAEQAQWAGWAPYGEEGRNLAFLRCWSRKEACAKAAGLGIAIGLDRLEVGCDGALRVVQLPPSAGTSPPSDIGRASHPSPQAWVCSVEPSPGAVGAVAVLV